MPRYVSPVVYCQGEFAKEYDKYEKRINELNRIMVEVRNQLSDSKAEVDSTEAHHQSEVVALDQIESLRSQVTQSLEERQVIETQIQRLRTEAQGRERRIPTIQRWRQTVLNPRQRTPRVEATERTESRAPAV